LRVSVTAEEATRGVLKGGVYGPGLDNNSDVELVSFAFPSTDKLPGWDKTGEKGPWALFTVMIVTEDGERHFIDKFYESTGLAKALISVGVSPEFEADGGFTFDTDDVAGRKLRGVEVKPPREYNGKTYNGDIKAFIAE
jgi:hypothetical protein